MHMFIRTLKVSYRYCLLIQPCFVCVPADEVSIVLPLVESNQLKCTV